MSDRIPPELDEPNTDLPVIGRRWTDTEIAFAKHRSEWFRKGDIPAEDFDLSTEAWWRVIIAWNNGDDFDGQLPCGGKPRFVRDGTLEEIDARQAEVWAIEDAHQAELVEQAKAMP